jgi:hypothetical protein
MSFNRGGTHTPSVETRNRVSKQRADSNWTHHHNCSYIFQKLRVAEARKSISVCISESELRNLSSIYPRLYQIPKTPQERLRIWINRNQDITLGWDVGDFLKTEYDDMLEDTRPRKPGYHSKAKDKWKMARVPLANNKGNTKISPSTTQAPQLSPAHTNSISRQGAHKTEHPSLALTAAP